MTVRIYKSTDAGAPDMSNKPTSERGGLIALLKAVLVTGYGSSVPVGWTIPFEDVPNNVAVFRSSNVGAGTGTYYRINDNLSYQYAEIKGYQNMTDVNTGTDKFPSSVELAGAGPYLAKIQSANNVDTGDWIIVATERSFYYCIQTYGLSNEVNGLPGNWFFGFVGDINSYIGSDPYCGCICAESTTTTVDDGGSSFEFHQEMDTNGGTGKYLAGDHTGFQTSIRYQHFSNVGITGTSNPGNYSNLFYPDPITARTIFGKIYIAHNNGIRGEYPGLLMPYNKTPLTFLVDVPQEGAFIGQDWIVLPCKQSNVVVTHCIRYNCDMSVWYS
jgi:hypothetical protein